MLFSNRYKFLFVHIAKTAGTSIQTALQKLRAR
ncbi:MAG: sulfotransferase, partial [Planctomycetes bacterium]|nr:sulfotransferase [Planctomycetota bacterium]